MVDSDQDDVPSDNEENATVWKRQAEAGSGGKVN